MHVSISSEYWIKPNALTIELNYFDSPNYIQVGLLSNAVIMAYSEGIIDFNQAHNFRTWNLVAQDTFLNSAQSVYVYARLERDESKKEALIIYDKEYRAIDGSIMNEGSVIGNPSEKYFYILLGKISSSTDSEGKERMREWEQILSYGTLKTDYQNTIDGNDKFLLKKFYDLLIHTYDDKMNRVPSNSTGYDIEWLEIAPKLKALFARFESSETRIANILEKIVFKDSDNSKEIIDLATSEEIGNTTKTADNIAASTAWVNNSYLSKVKPDSTAYLLKLLGGAEVGEAIDSFISGKGTILDKHGRIQTDRLEVRNSLKVLELIINRIQGMENDFVFAPTRKVVKVEKVDDTTYKLTLDPLREGDLIPFREGNILYSIVNDLLTGGSSYYTSYMRVLTTNQNEYSITVSLYPDAEVPGGKNYLPAEGYNVSRRGDVHLPEEGQSNPDAQSWYLSSSEGRLLFLQNVVKPVLEDYNYALSIGRFPRVQAVEDIGLPEDAVGVMAETIVAQHIYQYDYNGDVVANKVNRGAWAREVAESDKPYRRVTMESIRPTGTKYTLLEQHTVYHLGCLWGCLVDKTTEEPKWNAQGWQLLEGNSELTLNLQLDGTEAFHIGEVDVDILAQVLFGHNDITEDVRAQKGFVAEWFRDTENAPADNLWKPAYVGDDKLRIHIDNGNEHGVGSDFGFGCKKVVFTCRVYVPVDGGMRQLEQSLGFNLV